MEDTGPERECPGEPNQPRQHPFEAGILLIRENAACIRRIGGPVLDQVGIPYLELACRRYVWEQSLICRASDVISDERAAPFARPSILDMGDLARRRCGIGPG
ncbi:hypothetical protein GCM10022236_44490 [Microlunatus ginsengisoli]|uniref:Uncharacterized protein n=1 Tax=Microlunatus ginsengisoli TaxID=363863 RepID=A0ABP7AQ64_9ACTN